MRSFSSLAGVRELPMTGCASSSFAICSAATPMPEDAALMRIDSPALRPALVTIASCAVQKTLSQAPASIQERRAGTGTSRRSSAATYSACPAFQWPITRSRGLKRVAPAPSAAISPANSMPVCCGAPEVSPFLTTISPRLRPAARTRTSASPEAGTGWGTSCTSTLAPPGRGTNTTARIMCSPGCRKSSARPAARGRRRPPVAPARSPAPAPASRTGR